MFLKLLLLFIAVPLIELFLLLVLSEYVFGPLATIAVVLLTGFVGAWLAQRQGTHALNRIRQDFSNGRMPSDAVSDAVLIFIAGAFLMTPGILTDLTGFLLLAPIGRKFVKFLLLRWFGAYFKIAPGAGATPTTRVDPDRVIDSYAVDPKSGDSTSN